MLKTIDTSSTVIAGSPSLSTYSRTRRSGSPTVTHALALFTSPSGANTWAVSRKRPECGGQNANRRSSGRGPWLSWDSVPSSLIHW